MSSQKKKNIGDDTDCEAQCSNNLKKITQFPNGFGICNS